MPVIIPAILSRDPGQIQDQLAILEYVPEIREAHIDFADGQFVESFTALPKELGRLVTRLNLEAHLMVNHPARYFHDLEALGFSRAIVHFESFPSKDHLLTALANSQHVGLGCGMAIAPETEISAFVSSIARISVALILGVDPGRQGQVFQSETLSRVAQMRLRFPRACIGVDGGINQKNISNLISQGADRLVIGSAIWQSPDPKRTIGEFLKVVH